MEEATEQPQEPPSSPQEKAEAPDGDVGDDIGKEDGGEMDPQRPGSMQSMAQHDSRGQSEWLIRQEPLFSSTIFSVYEWSTIIACLSHLCVFSHENSEIPQSFLNFFACNFAHFSIASKLWFYIRLFYENRNSFHE